MTRKQYNDLKVGDRLVYGQPHFPRKRSSLIVEILEKAGLLIKVKVISNTTSNTLSLCRDEWTCKPGDEYLLNDAVFLHLLPKRRKTKLPSRLDLIND